MIFKCARSPLFPFHFQKEAPCGWVQGGSAAIVSRGRGDVAEPRQVKPLMGLCPDNPRPPPPPPPHHSASGFCIEPIRCVCNPKSRVTSILRAAFFPSYLSSLSKVWKCLVISFYPISGTREVSEREKSEKTGVEK